MTKIQSIFRTKSLWAAVIIGVAATICGFFFSPSFEQVQKMAIGSDRILLSRDGQILQVVRTDFKRRRLTWYPLNQYSPAVTNAITLAEDKRFPSHIGVDFTALMRAANATLRGHRVQGASTITMQLTDLIQPDVLIRNRSIKKGSLPHKFVQMWRAFWIERHWSKDQILEAYLNLIHLRGEYQGVQALSLAYLNKHPLLLDNEEAVAVAAMISSPNQGVVSLKRKSCVLLKQVSPQIPNCNRVDQVVQDILGRTAAIPDMPDLAPQLAQRLFQMYPKQQIVRTSIDRELQGTVLAILDRHISRLKEKNVHDGAAIVIDNQSGQVLAYVGAVSTSDSPYVDGVVAHRQAGSSLKPFIYAKGFDRKILTASSILLDEGTAISWGGGVYRPTNYDRQFSGAVSVREALGSSLNVPAVKALITVGLHQSYKVLQSLHFADLREPDYYGVSMALGAVDIRLQDLANAYRTFANDGVWSSLRLTQDNETQQTERVFSPEASFIASSILSDPNARSIGFGWDSPLETSFWTAVKTGTSKDYRDNWCVGYSRRYTVAVWVGNFNSEAMKEVSGVSGAAPSWYEIMNHLHLHEPSVAPAIPAGVVAKWIRHEWNSNEHMEYYVKGTEPASNVVETAADQRVQFVFPAEGSVLVKDPKIDPRRIAIFVRFKGHAADKSQIQLDEKNLGPAVNPLKLRNIESGRHSLALVGPNGDLLTSIHFTVKGRDSN